MVPAGSSCPGLLLEGAWELGGLGQLAMRRPEWVRAEVLRALEVVQDLEALTSAQGSERRAGYVQARVLKGSRVSFYFRTLRGDPSKEQPPP